MTEQAHPPMVDVDEGRWPVLVFRFNGAFSLDDVDRYHGAIERALARGEPFAIMMVASPAYLEGGRNNAVANKTMKWLKEHKPRLSAQCAGIAAVIADDQRRAAYARVAEQQGEKVYGCPLRSFATTDAAEAWLRACLAASG